MVSLLSFVVSLLSFVVSLFSFVLSLFLFVVSLFPFVVSLSNHKLINPSTGQWRTDKLFIYCYSKSLMIVF